MTWTEFLVKGAQIVLLNLVLSGDNVGIIALAIRGLTPRKAKLANLLGGCAAMLLRILFISMLGVILSFRFLHLHLAGGVLLLVLTHHMLSAGRCPAGGQRRADNGLFRAIVSIVMADLSMSFDNALAVASVVMTSGGRLNMQKMALIVIGLAVCVPVIFWGGEAVAKLMERHRLFVYICAAVLVYTAVGMIFEDEWMISSNSRLIGVICGLVCGGLALLYGVLLEKEQAYAPPRLERKTKRCVLAGKHVNHPCRR